MAIGAVSYLRTVQATGDVQVAFVLGKAKLTPAHATTIPRLELCAAVLGVEISELVIEELELDPNSVTYYTDSKVVLGYITNESRRFYVYVSNRVERIHRTSTPNQWNYVPTHLNPADLATRSIEASDLQASAWHTGPKFLLKSDPSTASDKGNAAAEMLPDDAEERPHVKVLATCVETRTALGAERFNRFSNWATLKVAIAKLITAVRSRSYIRVQEDIPPTQLHKQAEAVIIRCVQHEAFRNDIESLKRSGKLPKSSLLAKLSPVIDKDGLLRVGGRLNQADLSNEERHPIILPKSSHVSALIIQHYHEKVQHQGRVFTHGAIRRSGYWIIGDKRLVNSIIDKCIKCKRLRGQCQIQKMADLPADRVSPAPPFSYVGLDVFGPWQICARRTRGGLAHSKRWAVLFTCMSTRAIHIEVIESMDTSSFINALRRFLAVRGPVIQLRSDCGTNFVGARNELQAVLQSSDVSSITSYLLKEGCEWIFKPPHASHAGGAWERMIGMARRVLESVLADVPSKHLTHEVLTTLMAEVSAIVNARPLVPVSSDPDAPEILTPAMLLTEKPQQLGPPAGDFKPEDLFSKQWRRTLQPRRKWQSASRNLQIGDLVLLRCKDAPRNEWPLARITKADPDHDGKVRSVDLVTAKEGARKHYRRPVTETIVLKTEDQ